MRLVLGNPCLPTGLGRPAYRLKVGVYNLRGLLTATVVLIIIKYRLAAPCSNNSSPQWWPHLHLAAPCNQQLLPLLLPGRQRGGREGFSTNSCSPLILYPLILQPHFATKMWIIQALLFFLWYGICCISSRRFPWDKINISSPLHGYLLKKEWCVKNLCNLLIRVFCDSDNLRKTC